MALPPGTHRLGPGSSRLLVKTYREGVAAKVGHDLVIEVGQWEATVDGDAPSMHLTADARSLKVLEGHRGVKPLTDKDRQEIRKNIDEKILRGQPIEFRSTSVAEQGGSLAVEGQLTIAGTTRGAAATLTQDGTRITGTIPLMQSEFGIKPYRGLMGALKVRDDVEIVVEADLS